MNNQKMTAILYALAAALFYALNIPCSKLLLEHIAPVYMAAFLYLGAGIGVGIMYLFHWSRESKTERLAKNDLPYTVGMVLLDIIAPILLMTGVSIGTSANASLLGNFEIAATTLISLLLFHERVSSRLWSAIALITLSSIILSFEGGSSFRFSLGSVFVLGAAICWGFENNCTKSISQKSTHQIVTIKGLFSGLGSFVTAILLREQLPKWEFVLLAMLLGFVAYGLSIFTYIRAQKTLGASKTSTYYAIAPFLGAFLSFVLLREPLSFRYGIALAIMLFGTVLVVKDTLLHRHGHLHTHSFSHTHDGTTHIHTISHDHEHNHYVQDGKHSHRHTLAELERGSYTA